MLCIHQTETLTEAAQAMRNLVRECALTDHRGGIDRNLPRVPEATPVKDEYMKVNTRKIMDVNCRMKHFIPYCPY